MWFVNAFEALDEKNEFDYSLHVKNTDICTI